jgi:dienelactone hydrolase
VVAGNGSNRIPPSSPHSLERRENPAIVLEKPLKIAANVSRALDYAETRPELDHEKVAYYGYSWGAVMGAIVPAVEPRIKVCVFAVGGLDFPKTLPEVDPVNFVSRVKQPVLMPNGRYDFFFPMEASQEPLYRQLTPLVK